MFRYLLAVNDSDSSRRAAEYLANLTQLRGNIDITAIHAIFAKKEIPAKEEEMVKKGWQILRSQTKAFDELGVPVKRQILYGHPANVIPEYAKQNNYTQIVIGSRGLTDLQGLVKGSISHRVLNQSHCPVTLVK